jgi:hypothetical protein
MARRKKSRKKSKSMWKLTKGIIYTGAIAAPMYGAYQQAGGGAEGATAAFKAAAFVDPATGNFSFSHGAQIWTPVAAVALVDFATSKIGLQKRIGQGVSGLLG